MLVGPLRADTVVLQDGTTLSGAIKQVENGYEFTEADNGPRRFLTPDEVKSIVLTNEGRLTPGVARERLLSLRRSVEAERELKRIISRYQVFIQMNAETDAAKDAQKELDGFIAKRSAGQTIKFGREWVTPEERDRRLIDAAKRIEQITRLIGTGQAAEASKELQAGLEEQPDNVSMLYLNGVLQLRAGRFAEAKRSFDQVEQQVPGHPPTRLNQAVLAVQTKRWPQALSALDEALAGAPGAPEILDAVHEFIHLAPDSLKRSQNFERLVDRFGPQEAELERQQAARGLYRFGSRWVDKATIDQAKAERDAFEKKKADLEAQFKASQARVTDIEDQANSVQRIMFQMERDRNILLPDGRTVQRPLPAAYFDMQDQFGRLQQQRRDEEVKQREMRNEAEEIKKTEPKVPFTGQLIPIGELGVPVLLPQQPPVAPTTAPVQTTSDTPVTSPSTEPTTTPSTSPTS